MKQIRDAGLNVEFEVQFHPFMLDSGLPPSPGFNKRVWYASRLGASRIKAAEEQMLALGLSEGLHLKYVYVSFHGHYRGIDIVWSYSYDGQVSNTLDSHRIIAKARRLGGQNAQVMVMEACWKAYLENADDIGDSGVLAEEVAATGVMTKKEVSLHLVEHQRRLMV